jgi:cytidine deaminase
MEKKVEFGFQYSEFSRLEELPESLIKLSQKAKEAVKSSHSPYSHFAVGAAVLLENGEVVLGSNQENGAYPSGLCAERVALFYAGSAFPNIAVTAIAIAASFKGKPTKEPISPCGGCRQVMIETRHMGKQPIKLVMLGENKIVLVEDVVYLLPFNFSSIDDVIKD